MPRAEQVYQVALQFVRVLVFVHQDELKAALIHLARVGMLPHQFEPKRQQIVKVHRIARPLAFGVARRQIRNFPGEWHEITELRPKNLADRLLRIDGKRKNLIEHFRFRKMRALRLDAGVGDARLDEVLRIVPIEDGEIAPVSQRFGVGAQDARADGMEGAAPERHQLLAEQIGDTAHHLAGRLVGECEQKDPVCGNPLFQQEGDAVRQSACLARTGAGNDEGGAGRGSYGGVLLRVEFARVINLRMKIRLEIFQNILARHGRKLKREKTRKKSEKEEF